MNVRSCCEYVVPRPYFFSMASRRCVIEVDALERVTDEGATVRAGEPAELQLLDLLVEGLEVLDVERDADHPVRRRR